MKPKHRTPHALMMGMNNTILWAALIVATGVTLALSSCAGFKVSLETEADVNAGNLFDLFQ